MQRITAVIKVDLGLFADVTELTTDDVIELIGVLPLSSQEAKPILITYHDIDTNLIVKEHSFDEEGKEV